MSQFPKRLLQCSALIFFASCSKMESVHQETISATNLSTDDAVETVASSVALYKGEYITDAASNEAGQTVFFKDVGNKQLGDDFVPGDPRRGGRVNITYAVDNQSTGDNGLTLAATTLAIDRAMATWDAVKCSNLDITKIPVAGDLGFVSAIYGFGGSFAISADVVHAGFLPASFFNTVLGPGASNSVLGVTFTLVFIDGGGNPTDIDGNGRPDVAFREIYYNDRFNWNVNGPGIDIETVALHEAGHGLSQDHFGKASITEANGKLHISPLAVMNASYFGVQRSLLGTDNGGHCSNWAKWPSN